MATSVARHHVQLVADTSKFEKGIKSSTTTLARFEKAQKSAATGVAGLGGSRASLAISKEMAAETNRVATAQARIFDNLGLRIPQAAKSAQASMSAFNTEIERGSAIMKRSEMATGGLGGAMGKATKGSGRFGMMVQQGGYQMQDFTVQVMGGQSALVAFAQQGSQFAGIFGATGAMVGAGLAIGAVVAKMAMLKLSTKKTKEETEKLAAAIEAATEAYRKLGLAKSRASGDTEGTAELGVKFATEDASKIQAEYDKAGAAVLKVITDIDKLKYDKSKATGSTISVLHRQIVKLEAKLIKVNEVWDALGTKLVDTNADLIDSETDLVTVKGDNSKKQQELWDEESKVAAKFGALEIRRLIEIGNVSRNNFAARQGQRSKEREDRAKAAEEEAKELENKLAAQAKLDAKMTEFEKISAQMWNNVAGRASKSFADMVLTGENAFDKLANIVAQAMLEIVARMAIINPIINMMGAKALGGSLLPAGFGAGAAPSTATGGSIWRGETRMVGEAGPEMITAEKGGRIIPSTPRESSGSAPTYNLNYTFNGGVTPEDLGRAIPHIVKMTKSAIADSSSRWQPI